MQPTLGQPIDATAQRDAIHVAIAPLVAKEQLAPGQHVDVNGNPHSIQPVGIVDPFLTQPVQKGERFYLCLYPNTVTSLRHEWEHPAFNDKSVAFIEGVARQCNCTYEFLMAAAARWLEAQEENDDYGYTHMGENEGYKDVDSWKEFWDHYEKVTGKPLADKSGYFFTCSC